MSTPTLIITKGSGEIDTLPLPPNVSAHEFTAHLYKTGGYWASNIFVPWHQIVNIQAPE
jgi:hypothetical protein